MASLLRDPTVRSLCRSRQTTQTGVRSISSTASRNIGPESPRFVDVPQSIQPDLRRKQEVKGTLPVPRELFPLRRPDKPGKQYLAEATPEPSRPGPAVEPGHRDFDYLEWKRQIAIVRRKNLREGLVELFARKQRTARQIAAESARKQAARARILAQPERDDERLTRSSVISAMRVGRGDGLLPDPNREQRVAESKDKVQQRKEIKAEERKDALHTLYINARNFITNEEQLTAELDRAFPAGDNPEWESDAGGGPNIWNLGPPPTTSALLRRQKSDQDTMWQVEQQRMKKLAEALTGGTI